MAKIERIKNVLELHGVPCYEEGGRLYADSMISGTCVFEKVEDVTEWSRDKLLSWLGY